MVIISVVAVIAYRVILTVDYCPDLADDLCFLLTTLLSSVLNAASILLLGKVSSFVIFEIRDVYFDHFELFNHQ